jgi:hypothetical protein
MPRLVQGTQVWFVDPETDEPRQIQQVTDFNPGGSPIEGIDTTTINDYTRENTPGLRAPGQATMTVNLEPQNNSHRRLFELFQENPADHTDKTLNWIIGWSDGTSTPTADSALNPVLPTTRTWYTFSGYIVDFPTAFPLGGVVNANIPIQRTGDNASGTWQRKQ